MFYLLGRNDRQCAKKKVWKGRKRFSQRAGPSGVLSKCLRLKKKKGGTSGTELKEGESKKETISRQTASLYYTNSSTWYHLLGSLTLPVGLSVVHQLFSCVRLLEWSCKMPILFSLSSAPSKLKMSLFIVFSIFFLRCSVTRVTPYESRVQSFAKNQISRVRWFAPGILWGQCARAPLSRCARQTERLSLPLVIFSHFDFELVGQLLDVLLLYCK